MAKINKHTYQKLLKDFKELVSQKDIIAKQIDKEYVKEIDEQMNYISRSVIDAFYESYPDPIFYRRKYDLYNAVKIHVTQRYIDVLTSYKFLQRDHNGYNEYIYNLSLLGGYHGGAIDGPGHPNVGTPWYRKYPYFQSWSRPAEHAGFSPWERMDAEFKKYTQSVPSLKGDLFEKRLSPYLDKVENDILRMYS